MLDARIPIIQLCQFYDLPEVADSEMTVAAWCRQQLRRPSIVGDTVGLGDADLVVREMEGGEITKVGLKLKV